MRKTKFCKIPIKTFDEIVFNTLVLCTEFDPVSAKTISEETMLGATSGGVKISITPIYDDWGADIDNCPKNTKQAKKLIRYEINATGSFVAINTKSAAKLAAAADVSGAAITLRNYLKDADFATLWLVGDWGKAEGDFIAINLKNALSTGGLSIQTNDEKKGTFDFSYMAHYDINAQDEVPCEVYLGTAAA